MPKIVSYLKNKEMMTITNCKKVVAAEHSRRKSKLWLIMLISEIAFLLVPQQTTIVVLFKLNEQKYNEHSIKP